VPASQNATTRHHSANVLTYGAGYAGLSPWSEVVAMCRESHDKVKFPDLLRDPLIRLVMKSDGVTEQEMIALMDQLRRAQAAREVACAPWIGVRHRRPTGARPRLQDATDIQDAQGAPRVVPTLVQRFGRQPADPDPNMELIWINASARPAAMNRCWEK
jgi:hypothetical protein